MKDKLSSWLKFWSSIRKELLLTVGIALSTYLTIKLWLKHLPELFPGAAVVGDLVSAVSLSLLAAFVFFVVNIHMKEYKAKLRMTEYLGPLVHDIIIRSLGFVHSIDPNRTLPFAERRSYTVPQILKLLRHIKRTDRGAFDHVLDSYKYRMNDIRMLLREILVYHSYLDIQLIALLNGIKQSYLFRRLDNFDHEEDLTTLAEPIYELMLRINDLHLYTYHKMGNAIDEKVHPSFELFEEYQSLRSELRSRRRSNRSNAS